MTNDEAREVVATLREGDEVEIVYRGFVWDKQPFSTALRLSCDDGFMDHYWTTDVESVRVIKRAPLPEPPVGTPVWWNGRWWAVDPTWDDTPDRGDRWYGSLGNSHSARRRARWDNMTGAVPAATPGGDDE